MQPEAVWQVVWEDGLIRRVLPMENCIVVGIGGTWRDQTHNGFGPRGEVTVVASSDTGTSLVLDCEGKTITELQGVAPIRLVDNGWLGLRGEHELVSCSPEGVVTASLAPFERTRRIRAIADLGTKILVVSADPVEGEDGLSVAPWTLKHCECVVVDLGLQKHDHFRVDEMELWTANERFAFWLDTTQMPPTIHRIDWDGRIKVFDPLNNEALRRDVAEAACGVDAVDPLNGLWTLSYDAGTDRLMAGSLMPPHIIACVETDGRLAWCRVVHGGCCSGPVRRVGDCLVVHSGCGGVVTWLNDEGEILHQSDDRSRESSLDPIHPGVVEPGPDGCVFAFRGSGRLICFGRDGREDVVATMGEQSSCSRCGCVWWPMMRSVLVWDESTLRRINLSHAM